MQNSRVEYLDSLRGLASISVILSHFVLAYRLDVHFKAIFYSPLHLFFDGFAAVTFFFVLSGYVLTLSLDRKDKIIIGDFYIRRIFRIMPAYIVTLIISLICYSFYKVIHTTPDSSQWINDFWGRPQDINSVLRQLVFLRAPGHGELVCQNWTLSEEMRFSFLIPFLYLIAKKFNTLLFFIFNIVLAVFFNASVFIFHFSLGIYLALNQDKILMVFKSLKAKYTILLLFFTILLYTYRYTIPMYYYYHYRSVNFLNNDDMIWVFAGLGSFLILLYCFVSKKIQAALNHSVFRFIGKLSYSIYLLHILVLIFLVPMFILQLNNWGLTNRFLIWPLALGALLGTTFLMAYILTTFIEIPFVKLGSRMIKKYNDRKSIKIDVS
jgi:peptidoglycan/LPS O-acetylase OafA/YrhL